MRFVALIGNERGYSKVLSTLATIRSSALIASIILAAFGCVKKHQDLDEQAFVQLQVAQAHESAERSVPSPEVVQQQLLDHRDALLKISQQERARDQQKTQDAPAAKSLKEMIKREVQNLNSGAFPKAKIADTPYVSYENQRNHEIDTALSIDSALLIISLLALIFGLGLLIVEVKSQPFRRMIIYIIGFDYGRRNRDA